MSKKHRLNKGKLKKISKREDDIVQALQRYDQEHHPKGETLSTPTRVFRIKVVQAFLKSGTLLNRLEFFRDIFEEAGMSLSSSCNIHQLIPFTLEEELKSKDVGIIFDGTTREGEALVVLVRFVHEWEVTSRLVRNGNRTERSPIRSVIIRVINKIGRPRSGSPICLITSMITDRIGRHEVLLPINRNFNKICATIGYFLNHG